MKTEIIKKEPEFRPVVLQITLETPAGVERFKQVVFCVAPWEAQWEAQWDRELVNTLQALRDSL